MNSEKEIPNKHGRIKNKNKLMRLIDWISEGASKAEKSGGQCSS